MWIDDEGVAHTVALPHPADLMSEEFRTALNALVSSHRLEIQDVLEGVELRIFDGDLPSLPGPEGDADYLGVPPPGELLRGSVTTAQDLDVVLEGIDLRWPLDAVLALNDYID